MDYIIMLEAIESLDFPSPEDIKSKKRQLVFGRHNCSIEQYLYGLSFLEKTCKHAERVALKGIKLVDYLGIGDKKISPRGNARQAMFLSGLHHDTGKMNPPLRKVVKKSEDIEKNGGVFTNEDKEIMKEHSIYSAYLEEDAFIRGIIVRHHLYQKDPYPKIPLFFYNKKLFGEKNPEVIYLSKLLSLVDAHDASLTRKSGNNGNQRKLTQEESLVSILDFYGDLNLSYEGDKLPKIEQSGKDLINQLYEKRIFGTP